MTLSATSDLMPDQMPDLTRRRNWRSTKSRLMEALMVLAFVLVLVPLVLVIFGFTFYFYAVMLVRGTAGVSIQTIELP